MPKSRFYRHFKQKTDAELKRILIDKHKYTKEALSAANLILEERFSMTSNEQLNSESIEAEASKKTKEVGGTSQFYFQQTTPDDIQENEKEMAIDPNAPSLYSKRVIYTFSLLFSSIFGMALLMSNLKRTQQYKARLQVLVFGVLYFVCSLVLINTLDLLTNLTIGFNIIGALIMNEYFWNKFIGKDFSYHKRSWIMPAIISILICAPIVLGMFFLE